MQVKSHHFLFIIFLIIGLSVGCNSNENKNKIEEGNLKVSKTNPVDSKRVQVLVDQLQDPTVVRPVSMYEPEEYKCKKISEIFPEKRANLVIVQFILCDTKYPNLYTFLQAYNYDLESKRLSLIEASDGNNQGRLYMGSTELVPEASKQKVQIGFSGCIECDTSQKDGYIFAYDEKKGLWKFDGHKILKHDDTPEYGDP